MFALGNHAAFLFVRQLFARVNPVLPPRRRSHTARRWAVAGIHCARVLWAHCHCDPRSPDSVHKWAARTILDASPYIPPPPGWRGGDKLGGVERDALRRLASFVLADHDTHDDGGVSAAAWRFLYPATAELAQWGHGRWSDDLIEDAAEKAIAEWEMIYDAGEAPASSPADCLAC